MGGGYFAEVDGLEVGGGECYVDVGGENGQLGGFRVGIVKGGGGGQLEGFEGIESTGFEDGHDGGWGFHDEAVRAGGGEGREGGWGVRSCIGVRTTPTTPTTPLSYLKSIGSYSFK